MTSIIKVNNLQNQCGANTINKCGTTITLGASGDTIALASGASQTGFGQTYSAVSWDTTPKTGLFTAVSGVGYFCNTTSAPFTVTLPAGTAGDIVAFADYAATWQTNAVTVAPNGTDKIGSLNSNAILNTQGQSVTFVFVDSTQGWINTMDSTSNVRGALPFVAATGGTITTVCTDYKVHTFTGPGTFCVSSAGTPAGSNTVDYLVVAGGGGASAGGLPDTNGGGGGGAGGFRESSGTASGCYTASPLGNAVSALPVSTTGYPITVGGGAPTTASSNPKKGASGSNSVFSTITSTGGGGGGCGTQSSPTNPSPGFTGGSGGGTGWGPSPTCRPGGAGNTPPVSPPQGQPGGSNISGNGAGGGGGGATQAGTNASGPSAGKPGGDGATSSINATPTARAGGGGGGRWSSGCASAGGAGGGGAGGNNSPGTAGTINTGGGGGAAGAYGPENETGGGGGSGIVIIRYKFQ